MGKLCEQTFKVTVGFRVLACRNMTVLSDGLVKELRAKTLDEMDNCIYCLIYRFDAVRFAQQVNELPNYELTDIQFAQFIGHAHLQISYGK